MEQTEYISYKQWDHYARRIEGMYLKRYGKSLSFSSIPNGAREYIIETYAENDTMIVKVGWKQAMLRYAHESLGLYSPVPLTLSQI